MKIAIASGKGGTGKTTLSVALALSADEPVQYLDCDVEAPNGALFLKPERCAQEYVNVMVPVVNAELCNGCGKCARVCQFGAIIANRAARSATVFPEMCHACGGCALACRMNAITEQARCVGVVEQGKSGRIEFIQGRLNIGETMAPTVIRAVKDKIDPQKLAIIDSPPGTSCPMIMTTKDADFVLLVTEPTPFGLHDLTLAVDTVRQLKRPFAVVINRSDSGDARVEDYCRQQNIDVLLRIPESRRAAQHYSRGDSVLAAFPGLSAQLRSLLNDIRQRIQRAAA
ncbi:ATP-binding protein [Reinekea marinisedimentorum]|uniref:MinD superfamily P-loop ATPase n=1 Tax=Reinekea marinisedimentorum TaxID=230495 RepID=A0A4R3I455_9GAMM|nr:ATP-binding protein [Reinekea marinisedimentorum]TCS40370.1 MinD superfamily P-loop ATPase [Reinekea marinisedimentorum]